VVDGGSIDDTVQLANASGAKVITSSPGRAKRMNKGAKTAQGDILLFLHADTFLPHGFDNHIRLTFQNPYIVAGAFSLRSLDAIHLAVASSEGLMIITADETLSKSAKIFGI